jgi:hypothetical protein
MGLTLVGLFCWPTWLNGFPLTYYDSGFYIYNSLPGFAPHHVSWRPLTYSYLISWPLHAVGPFFLVFLQTFFIVALLLRVYRLVKESALVGGDFLLLAFMGLTGLALFANYIIPDVFAGVLVVTLYLIWLEKSLPLKGFYLLLSVLLSLTHYTFLPLLVVGLIFLLRDQLKTKTYVLVVTVAVVLVGVLGLTQSSGFSRAFHSFMYSNLISKIAHSIYYQSMCPGGHDFVCSHPKYEIWANGGVGPEPELKDMASGNWAILSHPPSLVAFIQGSVLSVLHQMISVSHLPELVTHDRILRLQLERMGKKVYGQFNNSRLARVSEDTQAVIGLSLSLWILIITGVSALLILLMYFRGHLNESPRKFLGLLLVVYITNAIVVGTMADPLGRYSSRILWLLPFVVLLMTLKNKNITAAK